MKRLILLAIKLLYFFVVAIPLCIMLLAAIEIKNVNLGQVTILIHHLPI